MSYSELFVNKREYQSPRCEVSHISIESGVLTASKFQNYEVEKYYIDDDNDSWGIPS